MIGTLCLMFSLFNMGSDDEYLNIYDVTIIFLSFSFFGVFLFPLLHILTIKL